MRIHTQGFTVGNLHGGTCQMKCNQGCICLQGRTDCDGNFIVLPGMKVYHMSVREELGDAWGKDAKVCTGILSRFGTAVPGNPQCLADLDL